MKVVSNEGLTKLIQLSKDTFIDKSISVQATTVQLANVATTGEYSDLLNKPTIPAAQVQTDWNASSGMGVILNKPTLSNVATTGEYSDLLNTPVYEPFTINEIDAIWNNTSGVLYYAWDLTGYYNLAGEPTPPLGPLSSGYYYTDKEIPDENTIIYTTSSSNTIPFISYNNSSGVMNCGDTSNAYNTLYRCSRNASGDVNNLSEANFYNSMGGVTGK